jgi:hypothetical protein
VALNVFYAHRQVLRRLTVIGKVVLLRVFQLQGYITLASQFNSVWVNFDDPRTSYDCFGDGIG